ncbi:hypothetical protein [Streptomyces xiaopingdaonensis]|uniref:hypothetical protein n=1 Tax=Streptomyces xiaopingdaonensis TaxID=1565415 RepID=UPI000373BB7B|nr:hypothetical protein [Streptomyces xiaopingdaonensis]
MAASEAEQTVESARAAVDADPEVGLRGLAALRQLVERTEAAQVANARRAGWSWDEIGRALGVSRQAAHKKHGGA